MPHWFQRLLLAALLIFFCAIQARYTLMTLELVQDPASIPRVPLALNPATLTVADAGPVAKAAGVHTGDKLEAVDGRKIGSYVEAAQAFFRHRPGDRITFTLRRAGGPPFEAALVIPQRGGQARLDSVVALSLNVITPWFCIVLAFLVAFWRSGDPVAYALAALLLCISQILRAEAAPRLAWEPLFTWPVLLSEVFVTKVWPVAWLWFAVLFPDPHSRYKLLPWARWALGVPLLIQGAVVAVTTASTMHGTGSLNALYRLVDAPAWLDIFVFVSLVLLGFANFVYKLIRETRPDVRRRLRWMLFGLALGVLPTLLLFASAAVLHRDPNTYPAWIVLPAVMSLFFTPLTLAYAVLVDRLFDVGMALRQGLLASKTVVVVRIALSAALIWFASSLDSRRELSVWQRWGMVALCVAGMLAVRRATEWLRRWVDRRFFQEAVNSERLLAELSADVRRIADPALLLRTVVERIANALHVSRVVAFLPGPAHFVPAYAYGAEGAMLLDERSLARLRETHQPLLHSDELLLPLGGAGELSGVLCLGPKRSEEPYSQGDIQLLESVANQAGLALENTRLAVAIAREAAQRERITGELEIARQVQERLFPKGAPHVPGLDLAGRCLPAQTIGGDYYDFLPAPSGLVGLAIGDVAGKGVPAALLMAGLQASLRGLVLAGLSEPADLLDKLNVLVYDATPLNRFATFFYGLYDPDTRWLRYSSAGHNPALLIRPATNETLWLKTRGVGLGLSRGSKYRQAGIELQPGDCLVLYTDGVTESRNADEEEFGEDRMAQAARQIASRTAAGILEAIVTQACAFAAGEPQHDDLTLIVARVY